MKIFGQIEEASLEQLSSDPAANTQGRIFQNTTQGKTKLDDGVNKRALLRNDQKAIIGNDVTEANNVRLHKGPTGVLQTVSGSDATAEGSSSPSIAQTTTRDENLTDGTLPAAANAGRKSFLTDQKVVATDDGTAWRKIIPEYSANDATSGSTITLASITSSVVRLTGSFSTINMIPAGFSGQRVVLINRTGTDVVLSHDSGATVANRIYTGTGANITLKADASIQLGYDTTTLRWQTLGEAAGAASTGSGLPNTSTVVVSTGYSILISDDIILCDTTGGAFTVTLPSASGNLGKLFTISKIAGRNDAPVTIAGPIYGVATEDIYLNDEFLSIVSDGTNWKLPQPGAKTFLYNKNKNPIIVGVKSTANVSLETLANGTIINTVTVKTGTAIALFNQTATEENGIYTVPASAITISATAVANENIATLANGSIVNITAVSTGQKVSLRFQTIPSENGIYVIGATAGTTVRDTSQRHSSYTTVSTLIDLEFITDYYNYTSQNSGQLVSGALTSSGSPGILRYRQTNNFPSTFASLTLSAANPQVIFPVKIPGWAKSVSISGCGFGGSGGRGGALGAGGGGGASAIPFTYPDINLDGFPSGGTLTVLSNEYGNPSQPGAVFIVADGGNIQVSASGIGLHTFPSIQFYGGKAGVDNVGGTGLTATLIAGPVSAPGGNAGSIGSSSIYGVGGFVGTGPSANGAGGGAGFGSGTSGGAGNTSATVLAQNGKDFFLINTNFPDQIGVGAGGGGGQTNPASRPARGGIGGPGFIRMIFRS